MSGWIPLEKDLLADPRFRRFVDALHDDQHAEEVASNGSALPVGVTCNACAYRCLGMLAGMWFYADTYIDDDDVIAISAYELSHMLGWPNFAAMLEQASRGQWLQATEDRRSVKLPNYQKHNGIEAKTRLQTRNRVSRHRKRKGVTEETQERYIENHAKRNGSALPDQTKPHQTKPSKTNGASATIDRQQALQAARSTPGLDVAAFDLWLEYRTHIRRKPVSTQALQAQAAKLLVFGDRQAEAVKHSMDNDWQSINLPRSAAPRAWLPRPTQESALAAIEAAARLTKESDDDQGLIPLDS